MKRFVRGTALALALVLTVSLLAACGKTGTQEKTLVIGTQNFDGKFSPFFYTNVNESDVLGLVNVTLLGTDREGAVVLRGIEGETRPYNGTDYTYTGIADCTVTENTDNTVYYDIALKEGVKFSDGTQMDIDDVIFSMYVLLDPAYDGVSTFYSLPIEGLAEYRSGMDTVLNLIMAAGPGAYSQNDFYSAEAFDVFWAAFDAAGEKFARQIAEAHGGDVASAAAKRGYALKEGATSGDFFAAMVSKYGYDLSDKGINREAAGTDFYAFLSEELGQGLADYEKVVKTGQSAPNVTGIQRTGDMSLRLVLTELNAAAIYKLSLTVVPLHYYGEESLYDYENNKFGFLKGDLSDVKSVTSRPMGAGPYTFETYENGVVTLKANPNYWKGQPKIQHIKFQEGQDADKISGVKAGTIDITDPAYSAEAAKAIAEANGGTVSGDVITTDMVANLGYGYVGFAAKNVCVAGQSGSEASKNLRKAIATVIAAYRDVSVDSYYGEFANVINYPISDTSWAAPRVTDEGYKVAFSVDVAGRDIYTEGMTDAQKYAAANTAALGFFQAAGYTVENGRVVAAPQGAKMSYEVKVFGGGTGDHPAFMALSQASAALRQIGFELVVSDMSNSAEVTNAVNTGTAELFAMAWSASVDPDMYQIYHSQGGSNEKAYWIKDPTLDDLIMNARKSTDQPYRKTLYKQALDIVADWAVEIPMYQRQNCIIFSTKRVNMRTVTPDITTFWGWANDIEKLEMN